MDMEIVERVVISETRAMTILIIMLVVFGICLTGIIIMAILNRKNESIKSLLKNIAPFFVLVLIGLVMIPFVVPNMFEEAKEEKVKVKGQATLQKYEKVNDDYTAVNLKGKDGKVFKIYLDEDEMLNQKESIKRGDKVYIKSSGAYQLKRGGHVFSSSISKDGYELKKGSELKKVE